jgi:hypothetical protein
VRSSRLIATADLFFYSTVLTNTATDQYGHKPIRPHSSTATDQYGHSQVRPQTNTATYQYGHRPIRPQTNTATDKYGHRPIRPQTNTATTKYGHRPIRPQTNTATSPGTRGGGVNRLYGGVTSERLRIWRHFCEQSFSPRRATSSCYV